MLPNIRTKIKEYISGKTRLSTNVLNRPEFFIQVNRYNYLEPNETLI